MVDIVESTLRRWIRRLSQWLKEWLFRIPFDHARIEQDVVDDICIMAAGSWPKEMIAFLTGDVKKEKGKKVLVIDGLYVKGYDASTHSTSFTLHDLPFTSVYGTVHSHPGRSNKPSGADKRLFSSYGWFHLIICQPYNRHSIAVYNKHGQRIDGIEF